MPVKHLTPNEQLELIRGKLNHFSLARQITKWLNTGWPHLNAVLGKRKMGVPWGRLLELFGENSHGKSALAWFIMSLAQKKGARVILLDAENSYSKRWARTWGIDTDALYLVRPYLGFFGGKKPKYDKKGKLLNTPEMSSAEVLCDEVRALVRKLYREDNEAPILVVVDSVTALETNYEITVDMEGANMKSGVALAAFLSKLMKKWISLFATHNATAIIINQLRTKPGVSFGNPEYTPGGKATKFYAQSRVSIRRSAGGKLMKGSKQVGIKGIITNVKNKVGGLEYTKCSYKIYFDGRAEFGAAKDVKETSE